MEVVMKKKLQPSARRLRAVSIALALAIVLVPAVVGIRSAEAQTFSVLYTFTGPDGANPNAALIRDAKGNFCGTTYRGGSGSCDYGCGTVFKLDKTGKETVLYSFSGTDGQNPSAVLLRDPAGNLYGTTEYGGASGQGTVFKLDKTGKETVLHSFTGTGGDGALPLGGLVRDAKGNLYSTTAGGGDISACSFIGCGVVFKLDSTGNETLLYTFTGSGGDGANPDAGLVRDANGNFYGTTGGGGASGYGPVFEVDKTGKETVLYSFTGTGGDGANPSAGLVRDAKGNFYGTTYHGGDLTCDPPFGCGTVFKLDKTGKETVLYTFTSTGEGWANPEAGLLRDAKGNLYGTTYYGGASNYGSVFKLDKTGKETALYSFTGGSDGSYPYAGLVGDAEGNLYGTASDGGDLNCPSGYGCGTVFKLTP
jgi:uncharacterized repeat protein (TIGR03803 family)